MVKSGENRKEYCECRSDGSGHEASGSGDEESGSGKETTRRLGFDSSQMSAPATPTLGHRVQNAAEMIKLP